MKSLVVGDGPVFADGVGTYVAGHLKATFLQDTIPKFGVAAAAAWMAGILDDLAVPVILVVLFWVLDWVAGVAHALADPETELEASKVGKGIARIFVSLALLVMMWGFERLIAISVGWEPHGKLIMVVAIALIWQETLSIKNHAAFFFPWIDKTLKIPRAFFGGNGNGE